MRKLKLDVDSLSVETFKVDETRGGPRGTVEGAEYTHASDCQQSCDNMCPDVPLTHTCHCW